MRLELFVIDAFMYLLTRRNLLTLRSHSQDVTGIVHTIFEQNAYVRIKSPESGEAGLSNDPIDGYGAFHR